MTRYVKINREYKELGEIVKVYNRYKDVIDNIAANKEIIATETDKEFDYICCAVGTGGTISGIINSAKKHQRVIGFPALKGDLFTAHKMMLEDKESMLVEVIDKREVLEHRKAWAFEKELQLRSE